MGNVVHTVTLGNWVQNGKLFNYGSIDNIHVLPCQSQMTAIKEAS